MNVATGSNITWNGACLTASTTPVGMGATRRVLEDKILVPRAMLYAATVMGLLAMMVPFMLVRRKLSLSALKVFIAMHGLQVFTALVCVIYMLSFNAIVTNIDHSYLEPGVGVSPNSMPLPLGPGVFHTVTSPNCALAGDGGPHGNAPNAWSWSCAKPLTLCNMTVWPKQSIPGCSPSCMDPRTMTDPACMLPFPLIQLAPVGPTGSCDCAKTQLEHAPGKPTPILNYTSSATPILEA